MHGERASKELDIRNAQCAPRLHGESSRKLFLMFLLRKAAKAHLLHALRGVSASHSSG